jgi:hypothetical protein
MLEARSRLFSSMLNDTVRFTFYERRRHPRTRGISCGHCAVAPGRKGGT